MFDCSENEFFFKVTFKKCMTLHILKNLPVSYFIGKLNEEIFKAKILH